MGNNGLLAYVDNLAGGGISKLGVFSLGIQDLSYSVATFKGHGSTQFRSNPQTLRSVKVKQRGRNRISVP